MNTNLPPVGAEEEREVGSLAQTKGNSEEHATSRQTLIDRAEDGRDAVSVKNAAETVVQFNELLVKYIQKLQDLKGNDYIVSDKGIHTKKSSGIFGGSKKKIKYSDVKTEIDSFKSKLDSGSLEQSLIPPKSLRPTADTIRKLNIELDVDELADDSGANSKSQKLMKSMKNKIDSAKEQMRELKSSANQRYQEMNEGMFLAFLRRKNPNAQVSKVSPTAVEISRLQPDSAIVTQATSSNNTRLGGRKTHRHPRKTPTRKTTRTPTRRRHPRKTAPRTRRR